MYLGDYIIIEGQTSPYTFRGLCVSTNTSFTAEIDEDKRDLFDDRSWIIKHPSACPFLRPAGDGRILCTNHLTSPAQCKYYRCIVMRICDTTGNEIGTVTGTLALRTTESDLRKIWEEWEQRVFGSEKEREELMRRHLEENGYLVR
jgi:hypothetical protein